MVEKLEPAFENFDQYMQAPSFWRDYFVGLYEEYSSEEFLLTKKNQNSVNDNLIPITQNIYTYGVIGGRK